jgi:glycogen(starch) synthase
MLVVDKTARMRVLMTADAVGGVWSYALDLSRGLTANGVEVVLAVMGPGLDASQRAAAESIPRLKLLHRPFDLEWFQSVSGLEIIQSSDWLKRIAREYEVDLVHLNGYAQAAAEWDIPVVVVAHSCVYSWWMAVHGTVPQDAYRVYRGRVMAGLRAASAVIAPTRWMLDTLRSIYNVGLPESTVISNFTYMPVGGTSKEPFILASGRFWDSGKNLTLLDSIVPRLHWPVRVAGQFEGPEGCSEIPRHLTATGQLARDEMAAQFSQASIFVHPARYEPFGLAVLEAASNGCALVLADIPSLRELWGECAVFASPDDETQWVDALNGLAESDNDRLALADRARRRAAEFTPEISVGRYLNVYENLIRNRQYLAGTANEIHEHPHQTVLPLDRF